MKIAYEEHDRRDQRAVPDQVARSSRAMTVGRLVPKLVRPIGLSFPLAFSALFTHNRDRRGNQRRGRRVQRMVNLEAFSRVTTGIYDAAIEPARWDGTLRAIQDLFRASAVALIERDLTTMSGHWVSTHDPETERDFFGPWRHRNIIAQSVVGRRPQPVETDREMLPKSALLGSEYYVDFLRPRDLNAILMLWLPRLGSAQTSLSVARSARAGEFEAEDVELGRLLLPHIQRALTVQRRLGRKIGRAHV